MGKVQVMQRPVHIAHYNNWYPVTRPKIHSIDHRIHVAPVNVFPKKTEGSKAKNERSASTHPYATCLSVAVHFLALIALAFMIARDTIDFIERPTEVRVEDDHYPMENVDFPGVAICNMNLISRAATEGFVDKMWAQNEVQAISNITREKVQQLVKYFGHLILFENEESTPGDIMLCNEILKVALKTESLAKEMEDLAPKCVDFMINCFWRGVYRQCHELFVQRWTQDGFCCTFNYAKWTDRINSEEEPEFKIDVERSKDSGRTFGLNLHLRPRIKDNFYNILPGNGFKVLIYRALDYPDAPSGGLREILIAPGSDSYLSLRATSFHSSPDIIRYDKTKRNCLFSTELPESFNGFYTYSQCMMACRVRDIIKICGCVPFFYPIPSDTGNVRKCLVSDLTCLKNNKYKWWSVLPEDTQSDERVYAGDGEGANLDCDCLPTCENVYYTISKSGSGIFNHNASYIYREIQNTTSDDIFLHLSFQDSSVVRLRQVAMFYWYDLLSSYGGLCSLFLGLSIITPMELAFLLYSRLWLRWRNNHPQLSAPSSEHCQSKQKQHLPVAFARTVLHERPIYWKEITPTVRTH